MKKINAKEKKISCNTVIVFTLIYILMVVISVIERVTTLKDLSTTDITFIAVLKEFWFPFAMIALLIVTIFSYIKREIYGVAMELAVAFSMLANVIISVVVVGFDIGALIGTLILPFILVIHSVFVIVKLKR